MNRRADNAPLKVLAPHAEADASEATRERRRDTLARTLNDFSADCIVILDLDARMQSVNRPGRHALGLADSDFLNKSWIDLWRGADREAAIAAVGAARAGGVGRFQGYAAAPSAVRAMWWDVVVTPIAGDAAAVAQLLVVAREITDLHRAEEERAKLLEAERAARTEAELLNHLGHILSAELKLDKLVQRITDIGTALCGAQFGAFFYNDIDANGQVYQLYTISGVAREAFAKLPMPRVTALFAPTFNGAGPVRIDDVAQDPRYGQSAPHHGMPPGHPPVASYLAVPVVSRAGQVIGGLLFGHAEPARFTERHQHAMVGVAAHAAAAIDNARLFEQVAERGERLRVTTEHAPVGIGECALDGRFLAVNRKFCDITGYSEEELLARRFTDITHPDDVAVDAENFRKLIAGEIPWYRREKRYVRKDGSVIWIDLTVSLARDAGGDPRYAVGVIEDITARKHAEAAMARNHQRLHLLARASELLLAGEDPDATVHQLFAEVSRHLGTEIYFNYVLEDGAARLKLDHYAGVPPEAVAAIDTIALGEELCGMAAQQRTPLIVRDTEITTNPALARCRAIGLRFYVGYPLLAQGELLGTLSFASRTPRAFGDDDLEFLATISHYVAIAKQRARTLRRLQQREQELRLITDAAPALISYIDADLRYRFNNHAYEVWFGTKREDIYGKHVSEVLGLDAANVLRVYMDQALAGKRVNYESWVTYRGRGRCYIAADYIPHTDDRGRVIGFYVLVNDLTARKQAEEAVRASEAELEHMADAMPALVGYVGPDERYRFTNEAYRAWFGKSRDETRGRHIRDVIGDEGYRAIRDQVETALAGKPATYERWVPYAHCGRRFVRATLTPRLTAAGEPDGFFVLVTDLTATKRAEERTQFLAEISAVLASSLDYGQTLQQLARLAVPQLADWCAVDMIADDGAFARVALAHADADKLARARALMERYPASTDSNFGTYAVVRRVIQSGQPQWLAEVPDELLRSIAKDEVHLAALRSFGFRSFVCAPLVVRGRAIGAVTFVYADSGRNYAAGDIDLIQEVSRRAAIAVDNARLYAAAQAEIAERAATEARLRESEARFQSVFANALDAILLADDAGRYVDANPAALALLGYTREQLLEQTVASLSPPERREAFAQAWSDFRARGEQSGEYELVRRDGGRVTLAYRAVANILPGLHLSILTDITERRHAERTLEARARQQETVARLGQAALERDDVPEILQLACELTAQTLEAELCKVLELQPDGKCMRLRAGVGWQEGLLHQATVEADADSQAGYTLEVNAPVVVHDLASESRFHGPSLLHDHGVVSGMSVPIAGDASRAYGVLGVHSRSARFYTQDDVNFLQAVGHVLSTAIQRRQVAEALRRARDELEERVLERTAELAKANETLRDEIVERMGVEAALRDSEAQYRLLFERNPLPAWVFDLDTRDILAANETAVWRYGYTRDELLRMAIHDLHPPEDLQRPLDYVEKFPPETAYVGLWRHRKQDDTVIDVEMFVYEVLFRGRWARLVLANDIT
ncbi:MAG: PAS domain S-box protein, partial [Gammaproteobacteria bacterium]